MDRAPAAAAAVFPLGIAWSQRVGILPKAGAAAGAPRAHPPMPLASSFFIDIRAGDADTSLCRLDSVVVEVGQEEDGRLRNFTITAHGIGRLVATGAGRRSRPLRRTALPY